VANLKIADTLYKKVTVDKDIAALIWWTKSQMGWKAAWDGPDDRHPDPEPVERIKRVIVPTSSST